ncbi:immunoglobulin superfamily member 2-like isoform X2 [Aquarana catesbeiana]|uniref:immunoglobulin superfamily member 2-like isoform X2 n=1 Tax=Aquarana catesbeiana TaxID=8400 RepID=UPI003CCA3300
MPSLPGGLLWLAVLGLSRAQHEVTIEQGPIYRTVGSHITIWCKVSGNEGASNQEFEFSVRLPSDPEKEIKVVSTSGPGFSYAIYSGRVQSRDIYVEKVSRDHTILHIIKLQEKDTGEYECYTPNMASTYLGTYNAKTNLTVIPNTLQVSMPHQAVETSEGASLELTCQVSMASSQHTHLSVSWILSTDQEAEILSLSRDFVLHPGGAFSERFTAGDVRMDKLSETSYRLTIGALRQSDQGGVFCRGSEWIQDPSEVWTKIAEKDSEKTTVKVAAVQGGDFGVQVEAPTTVLTPGHPLEVICSVTNTSPGGGQFRVVWLLGGTKMAVWEPSGVVTFRKESGSAGAEGRLVMHRRDLTTWVLRISQGRIEDGGSYVCEVTDERSKKSQTSKPMSVEVKRPELRAPQVSLTAVTSQLYEGDSVRFRCLVSPSSSSSASLGWFRKAASGDLTQIASILRDGQLVIGADYKSRHDESHLVAEKGDSGLFILRLDDVMQSDKGEYVCRYSKGTQDEGGAWIDVNTDSNGVHIDVQRLTSTLQVSLMTRNLKPILGNTASLYCNAKASFSLSGRRLIWSWFFQPDQRGPFQSLVQGSGNGELVWGESYPDFKGKTQISLNADTSILSIHRVQRSQQSGAYQCRVTIQTTQSAVTLATISSNPVSIHVQLPEMKLRLGSAPGRMALTAGQDEAEVTCRILERTPNTKLSIVWFFRPQSSASLVEILRVDREGVTSQATSSLRPCFISGRSSADSFLLRILRPGLREAGTYHCTVQEWLLEGTSNWTQLGEKKSGDTQITFIASDQTLKLPKQNVSSSVKQGEDLVLRCPLEAGLSPSSLISISWYLQGWDFRPPRLLCRSDREGVTEYEDSRLRMVAPGRGNHSLVLQRAEQEDSGRYFCQVEEWRMQEGEWKMAASDQSGFLEFRVNPPEDHLSLNLTELILLVPEQSTVTLPCQVLAVSMPGSRLSVSWLKVEGPGAPDLLLFGVNHMGEFIYPQEKRDRLQYERPSELTFHLRIHSGHMTDSGTYYCRVQEWLPSPRGVWESLGEHQSGHISVTILTAEDHLSLNLTELILLVPEQSTVTLPCQVLAVSMPGSRLSVSWLKVEGPGAPDLLLFGVNHMGEFIYPQEKRDRLQYERPSELTFHLRIHSGHMTDSGTYYCRVQEWLPSPRGVWESLGEHQSGHISVTILTSGSYSPICTSPSSFYLLLTFTILFIVLALALIALALWRRRGSAGQRRTLDGLWSSVKMSEMEKENEGQTCRTDDEMTPATLPTTFSGEGNLYSS